MFRIFVIGLVICQAAAVLNNGNNNKAEAQRREAPADTYGPPPSAPSDLPLPVYGIPSGPVAKYPPPPPDVPPPPPSTQYGVPAQQYGPPKVHLEYGPPKPVYRAPPQHQHHHHHHHHQQQHEVSFLDQLKSTFGFGTPSRPPPPPPHRKPHFPKPVYGPPTGGHAPLLPPTKNFASFGSSSSFGSASSFSTGHAAASQVAAPIPTYGPPPHLGPHFNPDVRCDGWKPIPGPAIQPDTAYGVPATGGAVISTGYHGNADFGKQVVESSSSSSSHGFESHVEQTIGSGHTFQGADFGQQTIETGPVFQGGDFAKQAIDAVPVFQSGDFGKQVIETAQIETQSHGAASSGSQGIVFELPKPEIAKPFHIESHGFAHGRGHAHGNSHITTGKINSFEISSNGLAETYGPPRAHNAYLPPSPPKPIFNAPNPGLLPPSGVYGVPPGHSYNSLAISHGSVSGNLKPWPVSGTAPIRPVIHRQPVPPGLIESIGHHAKHGESFNSFRHHQQHHNAFVQAPIIDIQAPHGLNSLPLENSVRPFLTQHNTQINAQALPLIHEPRGIIGGDCGHGPSNLHLQQQFHVPQPIQDSYGPPPSGNIFTSQAAAGGSSFGSFGSHSNFVIPTISTSFELPAGNVPHAEYGVPKFNQFESNDNFAFGSSQNSETVKITGEKVNVQAKQNAITVDEKPANTLVPPTQEQQAQAASNTASVVSSTAGNYEDEAARLDVAGLTGLNVVSAQKSQSVTIPVEGARGNYELQFQSTDQTGAGSAPHEQLLSEGLLQQILSAIETPGQSNSAAPAVESTPQVTKDATTDHDEVKIFLKSPEADPIINEPKLV